MDVVISARINSLVLANHHLGRGTKVQVLVGPALLTPGQGLKISACGLVTFVSNHGNAKVHLNLFGFFPLASGTGVLKKWGCCLLSHDRYSMPQNTCDMRRDLLPQVGETCPRWDHPVSQFLYILEDSKLDTLLPKTIVAYL